MEVDKAKQAKNLLCELDVLHDIQSALEKEDDHWWSLLTPDTKRWDEDGIKMPEVLREEFAEAVKRAIEINEKTLKDL